MRAFLRGAWRGLDALRRVLHLLLLLLIVGLALGALRSTIPRVPDSAALLVAPQGQLVEQLSGDPLTRAISQAQGQTHAETLLWDLTDAIRAAAHDSHIKVMVLDLDNFSGTDGLPPLQELASAIREFRASNKKVIAYGSDFLRDQYYIASQADEIDINPLGFVLIDGYSRYRMYLKDLLDKFNVDINVFRVGQFKSAVETYTRDSMSPEDREESLDYLGAMWSTYQNGVTSARHLPADAITNYINSLGQVATASRGATAEVALKAGLATQIQTQQQLEKRLIGMVGADENGTFHSVNAVDYARLVHAQNALGRRDRERVGVIELSGEILDGTQPPGTIGGDSAVKLIRQARLDDRIRAVVLRVDSPGGSVDASDEIYQEILALKASGKPVIVSMGSLAASGGYYISAPADEIWASPATITGSIGIFAVIPTISRTLNDWAHITVDGVGTTPIAGDLRIDRPMSDLAKTLVQTTVEHGYQTFLQRVSSGRHQSTDQVNSIGQGRVWAGRDALKIGLVDHLGSFADAVKAAAKRAHLSEYKVQFIEPELTWAQQLALQLNGASARLLRASGVRIDSASGLALQLDPLARELQRLRRLDTPHRLYAYCFCSVE